MKSIPTAEEFFEDFFNSFPRYGVYLAENWKKEIIKISKNHTKIHVEAALKEADKKAECEFPEGSWGYIEDKNFILNSYPLTNIK